MIADWQAVGFAHGVMNTDNMSVLGLTFDYGPYGFLDDYNPGFICNHSDYSGRYAFNQQPSIALWNLSALGYALSPLLDKEAIDDALNSYQPILQTAYSRNMRSKLGLKEKRDEDTPLFSDLFQLMTQQTVDYTLFFRTLSDIERSALPDAAEQFGAFVKQQPPLKEWLGRYAERLQHEVVPDEERLTLMRAVNPKYILRNYLAQQAIEKAEGGDFAMIDQLLHVLETPYHEHPDYAHFADLPPEWGKHLEISCSS